MINLPNQFFKKMKHLFSIALLITSFQGLAQLVNFELLESFSLSEVEQIVNDFGVPNNTITITSGVDFYRVEYMTAHPNGEMVLVSGGIAVPNDVGSCASPIASYQHGTTTVRTQVPSFLNGEGLLGVMYAGAGYVVTLPDFIGLGVSELFHLYVHADSQASASLDLIRLASNELQEELGYTWDEQLFLFGYSQGGHATMALHKMIEEDFPEEFTVTASAPMSGPYDISGTQTNMIIADAPFSFSGFLPYVTMAYQAAYGNLYNSLDEIFIEPYATTLPDLFDGTNSIGYISTQLPAIPNQMLRPEVFEAFQNDPNHPLRLALADNDVYDWAPTAPVTMYYCTEDEQVDYNNSLVALEAMTNNGATNVSALNGGALDHGACAPLAFLGCYFFFDEYRQDSFSLVYDVLVSDASSGDVSDGALSFNLIEGDENYTLEWSNGENGQSIENLAPGEYTLTVTDASGCTSTESFAISFPGVLSELDLTWKLYPNPSNSLVNIDWPFSSGNFEVFDLQGKVVLSGPIQKGLNKFNCNSLLTGIYHVRISTPDGFFNRRIAIEK